MRGEDFNINTLISDLQGTCETISHFLSEEMEESELTQDELEQIDNEIFLCDLCGWWCEVSEQNEKELLCN